MRIDKNALVRVKPAGRHFIFLDREICDGCGSCVVICPMDLWVILEGKASISEAYRERCLECGSCFLACSKGAVDFNYPPAGSGVTYRYS